MSDDAQRVANESSSAAPAGKVLLVDDEKGFLMTAAELLRRQGYHCTCCESVAAAQAALEEEVFDLLISDIRFPLASGMQLAAAIPEKNRGLPVIIVTAYPTLETAISAIDHAVFSYQLKPLDLPAFYQAVQRGVRCGRFRLHLKQAAERYHDMVGELKALHAYSCSKSGQDINQGIAAYMDLLLKAAAASLVDIHRALELLAPEVAEQPVRGLICNPEVELLRNAVLDTIAVLEKTKQSFKSKELAELRRKLEVAMQLMDAP